MKYLAAIVIGIIILLAVVLAALALVVAPGLDPDPDPDPVACTLEAKLCPDGSYVGRTGPDCEFEACPGEEGGVDFETE